MGRWYPIADPDGGHVSLPSVTTILDVTMPLERRHNLVRSMADNPMTATLRRQRGQDRGNMVDAWVKRCLEAQTILPPLGDGTALAHRLRPYLRKLVAGGPTWRDHLVYSLGLGYAGTLDWVGPLRGDGPLVLYELKTSAYRAWESAVGEAELQAAAYYLAWGNHHDEPLAGICTLHVTPYEFRENWIPNGPRLVQRLKEWDWRRRQFGSRLSGADEADHYV